MDSKPPCVIDMFAFQRLLPALLLCFFVSFASGKTYLGEQVKVEMIKPRALAAGDTIMIVAPAGELSSAPVTLAKERLEAMGFKVIVPDDLFRSWGYLAGSDEQRAAELMQAFTNPEVDAIFSGAAGYGTMRILDLLDYSKIRDNPKVFVGFGDITGLHIALGKKSDLVTYHSPTLTSGLGSKSNLHPYAEKYFWRNLLSAQNRDPYGDRVPGFIYIPPIHAPIGFYAHGKAEGILCGGKLSLITSLAGTEYQLETKGKVLFLEDVNETPACIDRMLRQMKLSGQLEGPAAVILGQFSECTSDHEPNLTLEEVFFDYFGDADYPVINNFPAGHTAINATLPLGVLVSVDADKAMVHVLENPVSLQ